MDFVAKEERMIQRMDNFVNITTIELPYCKEEIKLQKEIESLFQLIEEKQKERKRISTNNVYKFLSENITSFNLGEIIYNSNTNDKFVVTDLNPLDIEII